MKLQAIKSSALHQCIAPLVRLTNICSTYRRRPQWHPSADEVVTPSTMRGETWEGGPLAAALPRHVKTTLPHIGTSLRGLQGNTRLSCRVRVPLSRLGLLCFISAVNFADVQAASIFFGTEATRYRAYELYITPQTMFSR